MDKILRALFFALSFSLAVDCNALTFVPTCDVTSLYDNAGGMPLDISAGYEQSYSHMYCSDVKWMTYEEFVARNAQASISFWVGQIDWSGFSANFTKGFLLIFSIGSLGWAFALYRKGIKQI